MAIDPNPEIRCGFEVSEKRKALWNIELDLFIKFREICEKHNLKYMAGCGTLLGAVRHNGFIPWDDDMDILMPRDDYEKFCRIAPKELPEGYFIQTIYTVDDWRFFYSRIMKDNTTAIIDWNWDNHLNIRHNIFIDILPIDNVPDSKKAEKRHKKIFNIYERLFRNKIYTDLGNATLKRATANFICKIGNKLAKPEKQYKYIVKYLSRYNKKNCRYCGPIANFYYNGWHYMENEGLWDTINVDFEDTYIAISKNYDAILNKAYGDYMKHVMGTSYHDGCFIDTNRSYEYYLEHPDEVIFHQEL